MNNMFGGQKQQTLEGGMTQTNPFKETIDRIALGDERFENVQRARTLHEFNMERSFQNMNMNVHEDKGNLINVNTNIDLRGMQPEQVWNQTNTINEKISYMNSNNLVKEPVNNFYHPMMGMQMPTGIHPMLLELNKQILSEKEKVKEDVIVQEEKNEPERGDDILNDIINTMQDQNDERHQNSEFLKFIKRMKTGEIKLNEKENNIDVISGQDNIPGHDDMDDMWKKLENQMNDINFNNEEELGKIAGTKKEGLFLKDNPFLGINENTSLEKLGLKENIDLMDYSKEMLDKGEIVNARFALEAEVSKNSDNAEAWLNLGKVHTENDRDDMAIECFLRALEADPFNADALLALGVSCTNEFDEFDAMVHLRNWIKLHHIYNKYFDSQNPFLEYDLIRNEMANERVDEDYYNKAVRIEGLKQNFYREMCNLMENIAINEKSADSDLWIAMGIAHFIPHQNERAIECFRKAVEINPKDYNAWNKLGAMLAHSHMNDEAINTYKRALQLKPNYARCWANLGIAHFNKNEFDESMKAFLTSLKIFNDIPHVWSYMSSVTIAMNRNDLYDLVHNKNLEPLLKTYGL